jgi:hypothetical protein
MTSHPAASRPPDRRTAAETDARRLQITVCLVYGLAVIGLVLLSARLL